MQTTLIVQSRASIGARTALTIARDVPFQMETLGEVQAIANAAGLPTVPDRPLLRAPHHTASAAAIIGSIGRFYDDGPHKPCRYRARPGEVSLAHGGVLFLDDLPQFSTPTIEALANALLRGFVEFTVKMAKTEDGAIAETVRFPCAPAHLIATWHAADFARQGHPRAPGTRALRFAGMLGMLQGEDK